MHVVVLSLNLDFDCFNFPQGDRHPSPTHRSQRSGESDERAGSNCGSEMSEHQLEEAGTDRSRRKRPLRQGLRQTKAQSTAHRGTQAFNQ
jgi:hypothetical protein